MLLRKGLRDLRAMGARAVLMIAVIGAGTGTAAGILLALDNVERSRDDFYARNALADLDLRLLRPAAPASLREQARTAGATRSETRLIVSGQARAGSAEEDTAAELVGMRPRPELNRLVTIEGSGLSGAEPGEVVLEADFAREADLGPGDELSLRVAGRPIEVRIRGLVRSPEYLLATANPEYLLPQKGSLAVVFMERSALQRLAGVGARVNDLAVDLPGGGTGPAADRLVRELPAGRVTPRSEQYSLRFTEADIRSFSVFTPVMGGVFAVVGLLLIALSLRRLVSSQRRELGAMLALGYPPRAVVATVLVPAALLALAGAVVAVAVTIGVGRLVALEYSHAVGFPETSHALTAGPPALAAGLAVAATLVAALLPAYRLARLEPVRAMRGEAVGSFALPGWLQRATAAAPPAITYSLRTLLRRPLLAATTVLSIGAAIGLAAALNIVITSTDSAVEREFQRQGWTYAADLRSPLPPAASVALATGAGADRAEATAKGPARILGPGGGRAEGRLVGLPADRSLLRQELTEGDGVAPDRIVLSEQTAREAGAGVGDAIGLRTPSGEARLRVAGLARTLAGEETYLPHAQASALLGLRGDATSVVLTGGPEVARRLRAEPAVARVTSKDSAEQGGRELIDELTGLIAVLEAISLGVGALFLVSALSLSYLDRRGEFATLRALGYGRRRLAAMVSGEALTQTAVAAALSVPLGLLIASPLSSRIAEAWFEIGLHPEPPNYVIVIVPALALALLAGAQATRRLLRLNIAATVRARLIG